MSKETFLTITVLFCFFFSFSYDLIKGILIFLIGLFVGIGFVAWIIKQDEKEKGFSND